MKINIKKGFNKKGYIITLYGVEGVGKSTFGAGCEKPFFICGENGMVGESFSDVSNVTPNSWQEFKEILNFILNEQFDYKTIVIDTIDGLENLLYTHISLENDQKNIETFGYNSGYKLAKVEMYNVFCLMEEICEKKSINILITAHSQVKTFNDPLRESYERYEIKIKDVLAALLKEKSDALLFATYDLNVVKTSKSGKGKAKGGEHVVYTQRQPGFEAKNRFNMPKRLPLDPKIVFNYIDRSKTDESYIEDCRKNIAEITELTTKLEENKAKEIKEYVQKHKDDLTKLKQVLNRINVILSEQESDSNADVQ